ncbi:MAG: DUF2851 family protein [Bacteroidaceae bacterium]|nr:DUF2851 family protein [Bacteroidaceae bacterium]
MEKLIYYIWKNRLFPLTGLRTTSGEKIHVIDHGHENGNGTVFNDAKIKIGEQIWAGNVVLHGKSSDWEREISCDRKCTENTILHVTMENDCSMLRKHGEEIQQLCLGYPESLKSEICGVVTKRGDNLPCAIAVSQLEEVKLHCMLSRLLVERIEEKAKKIQDIYEKCDKKWDEVLFKTMIRSFGFGIQSELFEEMANTIDFNALGKHRDNDMQVEAIFFGQAGLLDEASIPYYYRNFALKSNYFNELKREFSFLENKFKLKKMDCKVWEAGSSSPHLRIARLAAIYHCRKFSLSAISSCNTIEDLYALIDIPLHGYWYNHLCFGGTETCGNGRMKQKQVDVIIINAIAPILYVYGKHRREYSLCGKAEELLHSLKSEENSIVRRWRERGVRTACAGDSQALLHLNKSYCSNKKCLECQFAYIYIRSVLKCL